MSLSMSHELKAVRSSTLSHTPIGPGQTLTVLRHLKKRGSISPIEALVTYGIPRLAARIFELREAGYGIVTKMKRDEAGHTYARYRLVY
jgi:hypothetical protein